MIFSYKKTVTYLIYFGCLFLQLTLKTLFLCFCFDIYLKINKVIYLKSLLSKNLKRKFNIL